MSSFGRLFRVTTFGESHGGGVGCIIDGVPPRMMLTEKDIQPQLDRRRPGQTKLTTQRKEEDKVTILSGTEHGVTLGSPICLVVANKDHIPTDYSKMSQIPRPSHADYTYVAKYGIKSSSGGGRSSARETIGRVAASAIAEKWLKLRFGVEIVAWVSSIGDVEMDARKCDPETISRDEVDQSMVRCPDLDATKQMIAVIEAAQKDKDSIGGVVTCVVRRADPGWGEPSFDKLEALLAHAMLSIPATKGFEIGSGFAGTRMRGSLHNDPFVVKSRERALPANIGESSPPAVKRQEKYLGTSSNHSGGIQGGITNGETIIFRVAFKPPATIGLAQQTASYEGQEQVLEAEGRHDPCVVPRAVAIVEAMSALVLADVALCQLARNASYSAAL